MVLRSSFTKNNKFQWPHVGLNCKDFLLAVWTSILGNYIIYNKFSVQIQLRSLDFAIHDKSQMWHYQSLKFGSKLKGKKGISKKEI